MKLVRRKYQPEAAVELNITAFLNLMVILVPFLLITAVFSRMTILEIQLPPPGAGIKQQQDIKLQLQLLVRKDSFEIRDVNLGRIKKLTRSKNEDNWKTFTKVLLEIKNRFPDNLKITLLLEPDISYKTLIQVMDRVRTADVLQLTDVETVELFPDISIGDAPPLTAESDSAKKQAGGFK